MHDPEKLRIIVEDELLQIPQGTKQIIVILSVHIRGDDVVIKLGRINNFSNANLENANFKNADLKFVGFHSANLTNANFAGADLSYAILKDANLEGANMENTVLKDAILNCLNHPICESD